MFELLVPAEKAQLDKLKGDKKAYDLELRPRLMVEAIQRTAGRRRRAGCVEDRRARPARGLREDRRGGARAAAATQVGCIVLGRGEDDSKVREWLEHGGDRAGLHRFRRRPHRVLGSAGRLARQARRRASRPSPRSRGAIANSSMCSSERRQRPSPPVERPTGTSFIKEG